MPDTPRLAIKLVHFCRECPFSRPSLGGDWLYCLKAHASIMVANDQNHYQDIIPDWCPLPHYTDINSERL